MIINFNNFINENKLNEIPIKNFSKYLNSMAKVIDDKLFFINLIDTDCIVDYGCADGTILRIIQKLKPKIKLIGYDIDPNMINICKSKSNGIEFYSNWDDVIDNINGKSASIFLSSVIHEVYTYSNSNEIKYFWNNEVFSNIFKYVIIRDMMSSIKYENFNLNKESLYKIRINSNKEQLFEFENYWGSINNNFRTLLHWLLKYRYVENWDRELYENYLPLTIETIKTKIPKDWKIYYENYSILPFLKDIIKKDFDVDIKFPTHLKMIIMNENAH